MGTEFWNAMNQIGSNIVKRWCKVFPISFNFPNFFGKEYDKEECQHQSCE